MPNSEQLLKFRFKIHDKIETCDSMIEQLEEELSMISFMNKLCDNNLDECQNIKVHMKRDKLKKYTFQVKLIEKSWKIHREKINYCIGMYKIILGRWKILRGKYVNIRNKLYCQKTKHLIYVKLELENDSEFVDTLVFYDEEIIKYFNRILNIYRRNYF